MGSSISEVAPGGLFLFIEYLNPVSGNPLMRLRHKWLARCELRRAVCAMICWFFCGDGSVPASLWLNTQIVKLGVAVKHLLIPALLVIVVFFALFMVMTDGNYPW